MESLLIRHAEPVTVVAADGTADPVLHERGRMQAERLAEYLAEERLEGLFSSPMNRAQETAAPVAVAHNLPIVVHDELADIDREATSDIPIDEPRATKDELWLALAEGGVAAFDTDP